ncbi:PaaI family thioesterase [Caenimonas terrae]|uniref:PaaI family thioesterase n=1 Tax=Caenimonas terrae TaxID=696074 RepID=A0ABW0N9K2_9BURK
MSVYRPAFDRDAFNETSKGFLPGLLGIRILEIGQGRVLAALDIRKEHHAPNGFLHAGAVVTLADTACGYGCVAHLPDGAKGFTTIELKSNHLGTALDGTIEAEVTAVHLGRSTHVWDATVRRQADRKTIALFRCTQMIL